MEAEAPTDWVGATPTRITVPHPHNPTKVFKGRMPFLSPNQQRQSKRVHNFSEQCVVKIHHHTKTTDAQDT